MIVEDFDPDDAEEGPLGTEEVEVTKGMLVSDVVELSKMVVESKVVEEVEDEL